MVNKTEMVVLCSTEVEEKAISKVLDVFVVPKEGKIIVYRPQINLFGKTPRTITQYIFRPTSQ